MVRNRLSDEGDGVDHGVHRHVPLRHASCHAAGLERRHEVADDLRHRRRHAVHRNGDVPPGGNRRCVQVDAGEDGARAEDPIRGRRRGRPLGDLDGEPVRTLVTDRHAVIGRAAPVGGGEGDLLVGQRRPGHAARGGRGEDWGAKAEEEGEDDGDEESEHVASGPFGLFIWGALCPGAFAATLRKCFV